MAENNPDEAVERDPEVVAVQKQLTLIKLVLAVLLLLTLGTAGMSGYWIYQVQSDVVEAQPHEIDRLNLKHETSLDQLDAAGNLVKKHQRSVDRAIRQFNVGKGQQDRRQLESIREIMITQQQDYQLFLDTMSSGMTDLANMVRGSRSWVHSFDERIAKARELSNARIDELRDKPE